MTEHKLASSKIVGISGQIGSGKSSFAKELSQILGIPSYSFGAFIRLEARIRKLNSDRATLQELGETLIHQWGPERFLNEFWQTVNVENVQILDGIRHLEIWRHLQKSTFQSWLIYLEASDEIRLQRLMSRDNLSQAAILSSMDHQMEGKVNQLKTIADVVYKENLPTSKLVARFVRQFQSNLLDE